MRQVTMELELTYAVSTVNHLIRFDLGYEI